MAISDWPIEERPREKLLQQGAHTLSDAELLAIFLRTGISGKSAVQLAQELLNSFNGLRPLLEADQQGFCQHLGLGPAKYSQLQAVLEMSRRHLKMALKRPDAFDGPEAVSQYLISKLRHLPHEVFMCLFLDSKHQLISSDELFRGTLDGASVYPREVVKMGLKHNASAVIFAHNHPSGIAEPSPSDIHITKRLNKALELVDIRVLDHFVIGEGAVVSMVEQGHCFY